MSSIDQFESQFKAASKEVYHFSEINIKKVLMIADLPLEKATELVKVLNKFLSTLHNLSWSTLNKEDFNTVEELLNRVEEHSPDLIITYRHLHSDAWKLPHSLGEHLDVLTQVTKAPVLVIPHPLKNPNINELLQDTNRVMTVTDHLTGDDRLVNYGNIFTEKNGQLILAHVEDDVIFSRYMDIISKIPEIDTELASVKIKERILKEPSDYIESCKERLKKIRPNISVENIVAMDHHLSQYKKIIEKSNIDLLIMNTKDEKQIAMHGIAYSLAVEIRQTPLLLI